MSDGRHLRVDRDVSVSFGACAQIGEGSNDEVVAFQPRSRVNVPPRTRPGDIVTIRALISHPMETGLRFGSGEEWVRQRIISRFRAAYHDPMPRPYVDGGYYTKTPENRPLIGPLPVPGAYVNSAFSGFGIMAACAAGELLAKHVTGAALPHYAPAFSPARYDDPAYRKLLATWDATGQL